MPSEKTHLDIKPQNLHCNTIWHSNSLFEVYKIILSTVAFKEKTRLIFNLVKDKESLYTSSISASVNLFKIYYLDNINKDYGLCGNILLIWRREFSFKIGKCYTG